MDWDKATKGIHNANLSTFGRKETHTYRPSVGVSYPIKGVFDENYQLVEGVGEMKISTTKIVLGVKREDLAQDPAEGDGVTVRAVQYEIIESQPDGEGWFLLILNEQ